MWLKMNLGDVANPDGDERDELWMHGKWKIILKANNSNCTSDEGPTKPTLLASPLLKGRKICHHLARMAILASLAAAVAALQCFSCSRKHNGGVFGAPL